MFQHDPCVFDGAHMAQPHDAFDSAELFQLGPRDGGAAVHAGPHALVDAQQLAPGFEPVEQVGQADGRGHGLELPGDAAERRQEELIARLDVGAVQQPGIARHDPADVGRCDAVL